MYRLIFVFILLMGPLVGSEQTVVRRIHAYLTIKDARSACEEAKKALQQYPQSALVHESLIQALAAVGQEREMLLAWDLYAKQFPKDKPPRRLIEHMCWGVLNKASASPSLATRLITLLAAYFSQDTKGMDILLKGLSDNNAVIRSVAVKLAGHCRDAKLKEAITQLWKTEQTWLVKKELISAIGGMSLKQLQTELKALIAHHQSMEEISLAVNALVELVDEVDRDDIVYLTTSQRAGLRLLSCQLIAQLQSCRDQDQLVLLMQDSHPYVRAAAFQALGILHPLNVDEKILTLARQITRDRHSYPAISAAWFLTLYSPEEGLSALTPFLEASDVQTRLLAAAALSTTGLNGQNVAELYCFQHADPYVKITLALGLINQSSRQPELAKTIQYILHTEQERWTWLEKGIFKAVAPAKDVNSDAGTLEEDNQLVRLEILNSLAMMDVSLAQAALREFLAERAWGITGMAAALLLTEGDANSIEHVQQLLHDSQPKIRLQAALVLSLWSHEETPIQVLEQCYRTADREIKGRILEGLGRIGSMRSVPFLIQTLKEPSQYLRIIAAMALIQCLNS